MLVDLAIFAACAALGLAIQRRGGGARLRERLWDANLALVIPAAAVYALLGVDLDMHLLAVVGCGVAGWWLTVLVAWCYARAVTPGPGRRRAALTLVGAFPNTGFIGFPLALLVYGEAGLRVAVLYDQISLMVPAVVVATVIARRAARRDVPEPTDVGPQSHLVRELLFSPPLWAVVATLSVRAIWVHEPVELDLLGRLVGHVVGPIGFFLLGLSVPLVARMRERGDTARVLGAVGVRIAVAPAAVVLVAWLTHVEIPAALVFVAALPTAFHTLIAARVHSVEPSLVRLGVVASTLLGVFVVAPVAVGIG